MGFALAIVVVIAFLLLLRVGGLEAQLAEARTMMNNNILLLEAANIELVKRNEFIKELHKQLINKDELLRQQQEQIDELESELEDLYDESESESEDYYESEKDIIDIDDDEIPLLF